MSEFEATHHIQLMGTISGTTFSWSNASGSNQGGTISDTGPPGLTVGEETFRGGDFTGFYIEVDGANFAVFATNLPIFFTIPYNPTIHPNLYAQFVKLSSSDPTPPLASGSVSPPVTTLENAANCFLTGTRIAVPGGARPIEALRPGDPVLTADGRATPVLWVWRQEITNVFGLGEARAPIRVAADALGPGCPSRDLIVTADHAIVLDGFLVNAGALVNGTSITAVPLAAMPPRFTYWHVETEAHEVLVAEGAPAESFIDYAPREGFDNHDAYLACHGADRVIAEMPLPRISTPRLLPPDLRRRLGIDRVA